LINKGTDLLFIQYQKSRKLNALYDKSISFMVNEYLDEESQLNVLLSTKKNGAVLPL
jgi:hypothetical protein